jgi:chemotaxis response regulator CheB
MESDTLIGVICDHRSAVLEGQIQASGYSTVRVPPSQLIPEEVPEVHVWVLDCDDDSPVEDAVGWLEPDILALSNRPAISDEEDYQHWCGKIIRSLDKWTANHRHSKNGEPQSFSTGYSAVEGVWILAAASGGIGAVSEFLWSLDPVPPVAFVYAQHIDPDQQGMLQAVGRANPKLKSTLGMGRHWLNSGQIIAVPAACRLQFGKNGEVFSLREPWKTREKPCIDEVMMDMSGLVPAPAGAIVFSGNGSDGCKGLRALKAVGTRVWVQSPDTADAPPMPHAVIEQGLADVVGSPEELAQKFVRLYSK